MSELETVTIKANDKEFLPEIYKKWFKAGSNAGFLSITPWLKAGKFTIDIGAVDPNTNEVKSTTKCYPDALELLTFLSSVVNGSAVDIYPKRAQCPSPESLIVYGGGGDLSRIFKVHYWNAKPDDIGNASGFAWKCGLFGGKVSGTGAIEPDWSDKKSADMIRVTRLEMHEIFYTLDTELKAYAARNPSWYAPSK